MEVRIPPVIISTQFNQHIDAAGNRVGAVHDRDLLM